MQRACIGDCPNIIHIIGCAVIGIDLAIVMEYVPLGDLKNMLAKWKKLVWNIC